jgi:calcineurin-like phosphoesterase family protein
MFAVEKNMSKRNIYVTSDPHFHHGNIIKYCHRPFLCKSDQEALARLGRWHNGIWKGEGACNHKIDVESIRIMNDTLIANINKTVGEDDELWILGDFAFGSKGNYYNRCKEMRNRINCYRVNLVWGNHDEYGIGDLFEEVHERKYLNYNGQLFVFDHYAPAIWRDSHRGAIALYGHSHSGAEGWLDQALGRGRRSMDVGIDNALLLLGEPRPFHLDEISEIMKDRPGHSIDHHVKVDPKTPREETLIDS